MKKQTLATALLLFAASAGHAQITPSLSLDFESGVNGTARDGKVVAPTTVEGKPEYSADRFGRAFKSGPGSGYLHFPTKGIVRPEEGTVAMWVKPVDWSGTEQQFHVFFDVRGDGAIYLYKFFQGGLLLLTAPDLAGPYRNATKLIEDWKPGEWHHIAGTWSGTQQHLYIDGKQVASISPMLPRRFNETFLLGDHPWGEVSASGRTSSSLIDKVRIYDRALSAEHVAALFAGDDNKVVPLTNEKLETRTSLNHVNRVLSVMVDSNGAQTSPNQIVDVEVLQGERVLSKGEARFDGSLAKTELELASLPVGEYTLRSTVRGTALQKTRVLRLPEQPKLDTSWRGNKLGISDKVPAPWTPLRVLRKGDAIEVSCWGRTYSFGKSLLPTQIVAKGEPLLATPAALRVLNGGAPLQWTNASSKVLSQSGYAVEIESRAQTQSGAARVLVTAKTRLEYDGLMTVQLNFDAPASFKPQSIALELPVRAQNALYRHRWTNAWEGFSGNVPAGSGVVETQNFTPFAWLGDNDRGLFWFCETGQFWPNYKAQNLYETVRSNGAVTMRFNLLNGQDVPRNWKYTFGLQATPVKPVRRDWRNWRIAAVGDVAAPGVLGNTDVIWPSGVAGDSPQGERIAHKYFGYPEAARPEFFAGRIRDLQAKGFKPIPYTTLTQMWAEAPEWLLFNRDWNNLRPSEFTSATGVNYTPEYEWVIPTNKDYADWVIWKHHQFMKRYNFDGYYFDQVHPYQTTRPEGGGWKDSDGNWQPAYPILAFRDLYRRFYVMQKTLKPNSFIIHHMSGKMGIPYLAYADAYLDGEHFRGKFKDANTRYTDLLPLDAFRAEYMGRQWGLAPYFLPELWNEGATLEETQRQEPARGLAALLMLHDVSPWVIWTAPEPFEAMFKSLDAFGFKDAEFIPYFDPTPPATTNDADVRVSAYKRKDGRVLLMVVNLSRDDKTVNVNINAKRLGVPLKNVMLWPQKTPLSTQGATVTVPVVKQGWTMLHIG